MTAAGETWVACLTPPGSAAIAVLGLSGPRAWEVVRDSFQPRGGPLPELPPTERFWLGRLGDELQDEVVIRVTAWQPQPCVEVHCHGGPEVIRLLQETFERRGLVRCSWQDWQHVRHGDPLQAAALNALAQAATTRTAAILLDQVHGAFTRSLSAIRQALEGTATDVALRLLGELTRYTDLGRHLTRPWRIAVAGAPNVGKSSLVNALAGYQRCIVAPTPGTTRDLVTTVLAVDGWPIELIDMAGLRETAEDLEGEGIVRAREALRTADQCIWMVETSAPPTWPDATVASPLLVVNKTDLPPVWDLSRLPDAVHVSARSGAGLEQLCAALVARLVPAPPSAGAAVPFTDELASGIGAAWEQCRANRFQEARDIIVGLEAGKGVSGHATR